MYVALLKQEFDKVAWFENKVAVKHNHIRLRIVMLTFGGDTKFHMLFALKRISSLATIH